MNKINFSLFMLILATFSFVFIAKLPKEEWIELKPNFYNLTSDTQKQIQCLAKNIYFEARNEPIEGQIAVAFVTLNRVKSPDFPNTICEVVEQRTTKVCQFSWYCESNPRYIYLNNLLTINNDMKYNEIRKLAINVYVNQERMKDPSRGSLYYHADYVNPRWYHLDRVVTIGRHIFYNERST
jgi:spore germination cell wall hydrolase CwlJ-like protein